MVMNFEPRPITCLRAPRMAVPTYDAEVSWKDKHYVVSTGHETREAAHKAAKHVVDKMVEAMSVAGRQFIVGLKEARP